MRLRQMSIAVFTLAGLTSAVALTPPIACRTAKTEVDRAICAAPEYVALDREIAALYDRGLAVNQGDARHQIVEAQRAFLKKRGGCAWAAHHSAHPGPAIDECIRVTMEAREAALHHVVDGAR